MDGMRTEVNHVVLLGDSIFDNKRYVPGAPDVVAQVREVLPAGNAATLLAIDGSVTTNVRAQLARMPADATHLVVSCGGNDALMQSGVLNRSARSTAEAFAMLGGIAEGFERDYRFMLDGVYAHDLPVAICTIYYPNFADAALSRIARTALTVFNDAIIRAGVEAGAPVIDLRLICSEPEDYANEIEPSARGGAKIARAIMRVVTEHDFANRRTAFFC